ncbi:unnamed protein product [Nippostrongylus brasiliensis]|uniref:ADP/ATP translocase n=1 Tax=Nippostrongylus brasiliensis TaxID=27835 RepID=A0A0N4XYV1_NIPBR|nr:unnamed protein product [Nippostrongylus brasiliensis]
MVHENDAAYRGVAWDDALKFCKDFAAGASAAVVAKTLIAPVERVKLILQLQNAQTSLPVEKRYNGLIDCFIRVPKEQGFLSFWRGNWVNILRSCSQESLGFAFKDFFKIWTLNGVDGIEHRYRFLIGNIMAGGGAGIATYMIIYPLDFVRTRLAIDLGKSRKNREFVGMFDCVRKIVKHDGIVVTLIAAMLSYPLDTVRRRIMMGAGKKEFMYKGTIDCAKYIYINEGWKSFFSGAMINAMRGTGAALVLALYNEMTKFI